LNLLKVIDTGQVSRELVDYGDEQGDEQIVVMAGRSPVSAEDGCSTARGICLATLRRS
jgi:hypothetical protein